MVRDTVASVFGAKFRITESRASAKRRLYDRSKVPASGKPQRGFYNTTGFREFPLGMPTRRNGIYDTSTVPTSTEWKRHGEASSCRRRRRAYGHVRASLIRRSVIIEMHRLSWRCFRCIMAGSLLCLGRSEQMWRLIESWETNEVHVTKYYKYIVTRFYHRVIKRASDVYSSEGWFKIITAISLKSHLQRNALRYYLNFNASAVVNSIFLIELQICED